MPMSFKIPALVVQEKLGTVSEVSALTGVLNLVGIPIGASFGFFFKKLHDKIFPLGFGLVAIGFFIIAFASNFVKSWLFDFRNWLWLGRSIYVQLA